VPGASPGCQGGDGGRGGSGGPGGGGLGGSSIGLLYRDTLTLNPDDLDVTTQVGPAGEGGVGGDPSLAEGTGESGVSAEQMAYTDSSETTSPRP
jgi:hypothetical protein